MSNMSKGRGTKGSKFWIQTVVGDQKLQDELNRYIGEKLTWISPLAEKKYEEYELRHRDVCKKLGISEQSAKGAFSFWTRRQPQWDGIAISTDGKTLYLVEAKAHTSEMDSSLSARSEESIRKIIESMKTVYDKYYPGGDFDAWVHRYYQLGNRLTFLSYLNKMKLGNIERVKLVLLNFVDDMTYIRTKQEEWEDYYKKVFMIMTGCEAIPKDVIQVYFNVGDIVVNEDV